MTNRKPDHERPMVRAKLVRESRAAYAPVVVNEPGVVGKFFQGLEELDVEEFWVALLNSQHKIISTVLVHRGSRAACPVDPVSVFRPAVIANTCSLILVHNHPSGSIRPSSADMEVTRRLVEAGEVLGIQVLDHVIVGHGGEFYSFEAEGLMPTKRRGS